MDRKISLCLLVYAIITAATSPCEESDTEISCSEKRLSSVPKVAVDNKVDTLDLSQNDLEELFKVDFDDYKYLATLLLHENSISYIEDNTFEDLHELEYIDLSKNLLEEIPENVIQNNKKLSVLDLSENLFQSQTPILNSESLEILDLSQCKLSQFLNVSIENLPNLKLLYLNSNNLVTLDHRMFSIPKLFYYVQIDYNPWECSCNTVKMLKHLTDNNMFEIDQPISCVNANKSRVHIYDKSGPRMCKNKRKMKEEFTTMSNTVQPDIHNEVNLRSVYPDDNDKITVSFKTLEMILKNEKIYFQEIKTERDVLDSVTIWTMKIFVLVVFLSGIILGALISTITTRRVRRSRSNSLIKSGSMTI